MSSGLVVTGTDTGVGKTVIAAGLVGFLATGPLGARYWKPIQAGLDDECDSDTVRRLTAGRGQVLPEAWRLTTPCSPHEAARIDGVRIDPDALALPPGDGTLVVEGAGGVLVPIGDGTLAVDLFAAWALPIVLVARTALGTINHSLLSLEALRARGLTVAGVIFSGDENVASEAAVTELGNCRHLGRLPRLDPLTPASLAEAFARDIRTDLLA